MRDRDDGHDTFSQTTLILQDDKGHQRQRDLVYLQKDQDSWMTLYFTSPAKIEFSAGTPRAVLTQKTVAFIPSSP